MQPTITFKPVQLWCRNNIDGRNDVVARIAYVVLAERNGLSGRSFGELEVSYDPKAFTEFSDLSEPQVHEWIVRCLGRNGIQLQAQEAELQLVKMEQLAMTLAANASETLSPRGLPWVSHD